MKERAFCLGEARSFDSCPFLRLPCALRRSGWLSRISCYSYPKGGDSSRPFRTEFKTLLYF